MASGALFLPACGGAPYPDYFDPKGVGPELASVAPDRIEGLGGGQELVLSGTGLASTRTVVIGGRNAEILEATADTVRVVAPRVPAGAGAVEIALATDAGVARLDKVLAYTGPADDLVAEEQASAVLYVYDCPIEVWGLEDGERVPSLWCGLEGGYGWGEARTRTGPGFAGELAGFARLSELPPVGEARVITGEALRTLATPALYDSQPDDAMLSVTTPRDFGRDLDALQARMDEAAARYSGWEDGVVDGPYVSLWDDEVCWDGDLYVLGGEDDELWLDGDAGGAYGAWLGFALGEEWEGETYWTEAFTSTAEILEADADGIVGAPSGAWFGWDAWSATLPPYGVAGIVAPSDIPPGETWDVAWTALGEEVDLGQVEGGQRLVVEAPDVLSGAEVVSRAEDLELRWAPGEGFLVVELRVYDADLDDPDWQTEVARIVARGDDAVGALTIPAATLAGLPDAPNAWGPDGLAGRWAELTVTRHQLRRVDWVDGGHLVIDFAHAVNGPVILE